MVSVKQKPPVGWLLRVIPSFNPCHRTKDIALSKLSLRDSSLSHHPLPSAKGHLIVSPHRLHRRLRLKKRARNPQSQDALRKTCGRPFASENNTGETSSTSGLPPKLRPTRSSFGSGLGFLLNLAEEGLQLALEDGLPLGHHLGVVPLRQQRQVFPGRAPPTKIWSGKKGEPSKSWPLRLEKKRKTCAKSKAHAVEKLVAELKLCQSCTKSKGDKKASMSMGFPFVSTAEKSEKQKSPQIDFELFDKA